MIPILGRRRWLNYVLVLMMTTQPEVKDIFVFATFWFFWCVWAELPRPINLPWWRRHLYFRRDVPIGWIYWRNSIISDSQNLLILRVSSNNLLVPRESENSSSFSLKPKEFILLSMLLLEDSVCMCPDWLWLLTALVAIWICDGTGCDQRFLLNNLACTLSFLWFTVSNGSE